MQDSKIGAVIVFYNPSISDILSANAVAMYADYTVVVDNTSDSGEEQPGPSRLNVDQYIRLGRNVGIARAFNIGFDALKDRCQFFVTLDQDSRPSSALFQKHREFIQKLNVLNPFFLLSPVHEEIDAVGNRRTGLEEVGFAMSSGCLVNNYAFDLLHGFQEELFIDYVDYELCLRARSCGYDLWRDHSNILTHSLGETKFKLLLGRRIPYTNHNYIRRYYSSRNRTYLYKRYGNFDVKWFRSDLKSFLSETIKIILFENQKIKKVRSIFLGVRDGIKGKLGTYDY